MKVALETDTLNTYGTITGCPTNPPPPVGYRRKKCRRCSQKSTALGGFFTSVYKTWDPSKWAWPWVSLTMKSPSTSVYHIFWTVECRWLNAFSQKKESLAITRDTHNEDRVKTTDQSHLLNIWTIVAMDRSHARTPAKLRCLRRPLMESCVKFLLIFSPPSQ